MNEKLINISLSPMPYIRHIFNLFTKQTLLKLQLYIMHTACRVCNI